MEAEPLAVREAGETTRADLHGHASWLTTGPELDEQRQVLCAARGSYILVGALCAPEASGLDVP